MQKGDWYDQSPEYGNRQPIKDIIYRLFSSDWKSWGAFASTRYYGEVLGGTDFLSLEFIHNNVHVSYSLYDPPEISLFHCA